MANQPASVAWIEWYPRRLNSLAVVLRAIHARLLTFGSRQRIHQIVQDGIVLRCDPPQANQEDIGFRQLGNLVSTSLPMGIHMLRILNHLLAGAVDSRLSDNHSSVNGRLGRHGRHGRGDEHVWATARSTLSRLCSRWKRVSRVAPLRPTSRAEARRDQRLGESAPRPEGQQRGRGQCGQAAWAVATGLSSYFGA